LTADGAAAALRAFLKRKGREKRSLGQVVVPCITFLLKETTAAPRARQFNGLAAGFAFAMSSISGMSFCYFV